jgi:hypothetical protein
MSEKDQDRQVIIVAAGESANLPPTAISLEQVVRQVVDEVLEGKLEEHFSKIASEFGEPASKRRKTEPARPAPEALAEVEPDIWVQLPPQREFALNMLLDYGGRAKPTFFPDWVEDGE